jgi:hypothetical protein
MKKALFALIISFLIPFGIFLALNSIEIVFLFESNIFHGVLMVLLSILAFYTAYRAYLAYKYTSDIQEFTLSLAFYVFGFGFLYHGIFIPDLLFFDELVFDILEHTAFFFGAVLLLALVFPVEKWKKMIFKNTARIFVALTAALIAYPAFILSSPPLAEYLGKALNSITWLTAVLFFVVALSLANQYRRTKAPLLIYLIAGFAILINLGIIPFFYEHGGLIWWYWHLMSLAGYLAVLVGINRAGKYRLMQ